MRSALHSGSSCAKNRRSRHFIARHLTLWLVLMIPGSAVVLSSVLAGAQVQSRKSAVGTTLTATSSAAPGAAAPEQESTEQNQVKSIDEASAQAQSVPILTQQNAPDIPQCREILNQEILDLVNAAAEDPAETFEKNRLAHPHSIMMPPPLDCASKLWVAARRNSSAADSAMGSEFLSFGPKSIETLFNQGALNTSVGTNTNPAGGIEGYQGTTSISIDPNNPLHLIASSNTFYKDPISTCQSPTGGTANTYGTIALFGSTDGGATWTYNCAPWPATITGGVTGATFWFGSYPTLAWDNQGRAYVSYLLISQSASAYGAAIVVARSSDNGASWQSLGTVVNGIASTTQGNDKEMMAIDNTSGQAFSHSGRIYVIWHAANAAKIAYSDNGTAWTTVNFPSNTGSSGGNVVVGADGTVYVIWSRYNVETIVFSKSTDGGATWTAPQVIATLALQSFGSNNKPPAQDKRGVNGFGAIDVDRNPASSSFGNLYVSFSDFPSGTTTGADINTYVVRSTNGGTSWSSRVKVNDDNFAATQMFPWLAVDQSDGTLNVSWYDTRLDPLNRKTQAVYARSIDGGASFEPNVLVSDGGANWKNNVNYSDENSADNPTYNSNQYGDYSGVAALNRQAHPLWTDSRMFFPVADTQSPTRREDIATATITNCSSPSAIAAPAVNPSTAPSVAVSWSAPAGWGTPATTGTYSVFRNTSAVFPSGSPVASDLTSTNYVDTTGNSGTTYYYFVRAKNNCPGTALTPMTTDSPASAAVDFGSTGTSTGTLQGTVMAGALPVSGVTVTAGTLSATTNASGFYLFAAIDPSTYTMSASPTGYYPESVNGVIVTGGGTTIQNLALSPISSGSCSTDTTYADFVTGAGTNLDIAGNPDDVKLKNLGVEASDQISSPAALSTTNNLSATTWTGQTFRAGVTGNLTKLTVGLGLASGTSGTITVEIRNLSGITPGTTVLATGTVGPVTNVGSAALYTMTFATPAAVVSGTSYAIVLRTSVGSTVFGVRGSTAGGSSLANGQVFTTTNSGTAWTGVAADLWFTTYVTPPLAYPLSANLVSGVKDANPVVGLVPRWLTLSWNATTPPNTTVQFQVAASNNVNGPFNFVGPDGTAATFFTTSGDSLSQFNDFRYLKYQALLSTTDNVITPTLSDVTVCFDNDTPLISVAGPLSRQQGSGSINEQIAIVSDPGQAANTLIVTATPLTGTGVSINNISVAPAGNVTANVAASLTATNSTFTLAVKNNANVTVTQTLAVNVTVVATPSITPDGPTTFCAGGSVTLTSSSASGNQWYLNGNPIGGATNQGYIATVSGDYTVTATTSAPSTATTVTVNPLPATPTITPGGPTTFCTGGSVTLTSSSASGNQWYLDGNPIGGATNQQYVATASGNYTTTVTANCCDSAPSTATTVTVNPIPATPTITPGGPTSFTDGGSVTLTSSSATGNQWYLNGNPIGGATNQQYIATVSGDYSTMVTNTGCSSAASAATTVTVNPIPGTPTITPGGATTFCAGGSVPLTSSSAAGNQWYLNGNPVGGATAQQYNAATAGDYTVTVTTDGATSPPSSATTVTANTAPTLTYPTAHTVNFAGLLNVTPTAASDNGTVTYQVLAGHGLATAPTVNSSGGVSITNAQPAGAHSITVRATDNCGAITDATFTLQVQSPANASGTKTVTGTLAPGGSITYTITLSNINPSPQLDNPGNEFIDVLPSSLTLVSANATSGSAIATLGTNTVTWNGSIAGSGLVTITITANIKNVPDGTVVSNQGMISYDADGNGTNEASRVTDDPSVAGASDPTRFTVGDTNDPPDAVDDTLTSVAEDSGMRTIAISSLLSNDTNGPSNESGQTFTLTSVSSPVGGTVTSDATNVYFTPAADFNGAASFQYTVIDNGTTNGVADLKSDTATVSFLITEVNNAPSPVNDPLGNMAEDAPQRTIPFSALTNNDSRGAANESGQTLIVKTVSNPVGLTVSIVAGTVRFTPLPDYTGPASFRYTVEDNGTTNGVAAPKTSATSALAHFNITQVNDAPTAVNDILPNFVEDSGPQTIPFDTLTVNDSKGPANENGQTLIVKTVGNPIGGTISIVAGDVVFTPTANYFGPASFDYTVEDNGTTNGAADPRTSAAATASFDITAVADAPSVTNATTNANTQTTSGLVISRNPSDGAEVTHFKITGITGGSLFKNDGVNPINNGDFITFTEGNGGLKFTPGTTNGSFLVQASLSNSDAGLSSLSGGTAVATIVIDPLGGVIRFTAANYSVAEGAGFRTITVERSGDTSQSATVDYATSDQSDPPALVPCSSPGAGFASSRCDFTTAIGTLRFAAGETSKTFNVLINQDNYVEGAETLSLTLSNPVGGAVFGVPAAATLQITDDANSPATNPIDDSSVFVRALYHDMLNREPDGPGLAFWTDNIEKCNDPARRPADQTVAQCTDKQREATAIAFFMSPEFQMTGGFVYRLYKGSLSGMPNYGGGLSDAPGRFPTSVEFMHDMSQVSEGIVVNNQLSGAVVEANRNRLAAEFVQRPEFVAKYLGLNNTLFVQELFNSSGVAATATEKQALVDGLTNGTETRASVLRKVLDGTVVTNEGNVLFTTPYGQAFINQENRRLFVYMEYIGYLRRNPDAAGFTFWLGKLNFFKGDPFQAEMVRSFILSPEYRSRFGQP
jgi:hypothetical protein